MVSSILVILESWDEGSLNASFMDHISMTYLWTTVRCRWAILNSNNLFNTSAGCTLSCSDGSNEVYDKCIIAVHAPDAIRILGKEATYDETTILGAFQYVYRFGFLCQTVSSPCKSTPVAFWIVNHNIILKLYFLFIYSLQWIPYDIISQWYIPPSW